MRYIGYLSLLIACFSCNARQVPAATIVVSDINRFWIAYDSVLTLQDTTAQKEVLQTLYYDKASSGLQEFMQLRQHSSSRLLKNILSKPAFWSSVRPLTLRIPGYTAQIETLLKKFRQLYPAFRQPAVYFTIGCLNSGGTTTKTSVLIGAEIAAADNTVASNELNSWLQRVFRDNQNVVYLVAHELTHTQQNDTGADENELLNLLGFCLREGACDFIAEQLLDQPVRSPYMSYGKAHEQQLWEQFKAAMYGKDIKDWLYNGADAPNGQADLGYFMGYTICRSYYERATDKQKALAEIISLDYTSQEKVNDFFIRSGYGTHRQ